MAAWMERWKYDILIHLYNFFSDDIINMSLIRVLSHRIC